MDNEIAKLRKKIDEYEEILEWVVNSMTTEDQEDLREMLEQAQKSKNKETRVKEKQQTKSQSYYGEFHAYTNDEIDDDSNDDDLPAIKTYRVYEPLKIIKQRKSKNYTFSK